MRKVFIAVVFIILLTGTAMAFPNEPTGFQYWRLGMSFEEAEPWLVFVRRAEYAGCTIYKPMNSSFYGYPIEIELSFHRGKLVSIYFKSKDANIKDVWYAEFLKRFGEPTEKDDNTYFEGFYSRWVSEKVYVSFDGRYTSTGTSEISVTIEDTKYYDLLSSLFRYTGW